MYKMRMVLKLDSLTVCCSRSVQTVLVKPKSLKVPEDFLWPSEVYCAGRKVSKKYKKKSSLKKVQKKVKIYLKKLDLTQKREFTQKNEFTQKVLKK